MPNIIIPRPGLWKPPAGSVIDFAHPLSRGLVGLWAMNEGGGLLANDACNKNGGALTNGPSWSGGRYGNALKFDGTDDHLALGVPKALDVLTAYTIAARVNIQSTSGLQNIIFKGDGAAGQYGLLMRNDLAAGRWTIQGVSDLQCTDLSIGKWVFLVATSDGTTAKGYVDGALVASGAHGIPNKSASSVYIGADVVNGRYFNGFIESVHMYNRVFSLEEVKWLYEEPYAMFRGPEIMRRYWAFGAPLPRVAPGTSGGQIVRRSTVVGF